VRSYLEAAHLLFIPIRDTHPVTDRGLPPQEPDYRMSLAAERTYLAYLRTGLALLAAGVGVVIAAPSTNRAAQDVRRALGVALIVASGALLGTARQRWCAIEHAMRRGQPLPRANVAAFLGPFLVIVAAGAIAVVLLA
jgi:putative membrane protein